MNEFQSKTFWQVCFIKVFYQDNLVCVSPKKYAAKSKCYQIIVHMQVYIDQQFMPSVNANK